MDIPVLIIYYNTPELTSATVKSVWKHTPQAKITIFDNSDKYPFPIKDFPQIRYLDNTKGQIVNWEEWLKQFPEKRETKNGYGSAKHCWSVEICFQYFPEGFVLMDSDVLIKKDFSSIFDPKVPYFGSISRTKKLKELGLLRICPFLCFINVPLLKKYNIHYTDKKTLLGLSLIVPYTHYEPGTYLLLECQKHRLKGRNFKLHEYYIHLGHGSWGKKYEKWLKANKKYYI